MGLANFDKSSERAQSLAKDIIAQVNTMVELLDMPGLLRDEFVLHLGTAATTVTRIPSP